MDRMNPPPNYYGAMYPNSNGPVNSPFQNGNNMTSPPPYTDDNTPAFKTANVANDTGVQDAYVPESYIRIEEGVAGVKKFYENFKRFISENIGSRVKVYCAFTDSSLWHDKVFEGTLIAAADNYVLVKENETNKYVIIASVYVIYMELFEK